MALLDIDEFRVTASAARRRTVVGVLLTFLAVVAYIGVLYALAEYGGFRQLRNGNSTTGVLAMSGMIPICLGSMWLAIRWAQRHPQLSCPHCRRSLAESTRIVIATRNCPHCGRRVLAEPE